MIKTSLEKMDMHKYLSTYIFTYIIILLVIILHDENWNKITRICKSDTSTSARMWVAIKHYNSTHQLRFSQPSNGWNPKLWGKKQGPNPRERHLWMGIRIYHSDGYEIKLRKHAPDSIFQENLAQIYACNLLVPLNQASVPWIMGIKAITIFFGCYRVSN